MKSANQLSQQLLLAMKMQEAPEELMAELAAFPLNKLKAELVNDDYKKAFWINIYNAWFLILRKLRKLEKATIYTDKGILVAGEALSLDDVEHGILRRYRYKFSLGYLPNLFAASLIKKLAASAIDHRIHFALNCGAVSCPPIAFYDPTNIEQQLDMASRSFLESETTIDSGKGVIHVSRILLWYLGDFGGNRGIRKMLSSIFNKDFYGYTIVSKPYDWTEALDNFSDNW